MVELKAGDASLNSRCSWKEVFLGKDREVYSGIMANRTSEAEAHGRSLKGKRSSKLEISHRKER